MLFVPCFVLLLIYGHPVAATVLFLLAAVTDGLDGLIARKLQQKTVLGSFLDPMADKLLLTAAFITAHYSFAAPGVAYSDMADYLDNQSGCSDRPFSPDHPSPDATFQVSAQFPWQMHHHGSAPDSGRMLAG